MRSRHKKIVGLALGERSLLAAEVIVQDRPRVTRLVEWAYPTDQWPAEAAQVGAALGPFLRMQGFAGRAAVVGLPLKWLLARPAAVPATDAATLAPMLRLKAETIFSGDSKDMVLEYTGSGPVLLLGTPGKYIAAARELCRAAGLHALAVTPTALALGQAVAAGQGAAALVLAVQGDGCELSSLRGGTAEAMQYLRGPAAGGAFVSELRRTLSGWHTSDAARDLVLWDGGSAAVDAVALSGALGLRVRSGALSALGVQAADTGINGEASKFAGAVALALGAARGGAQRCDFLHSRLAPPRERRMPRWTAGAVAAGVLLLAAVIYGYVDLSMRQGQIADLQHQLDADKPAVEAATAFVSKVSFAQGWEADAPRYLACIRDLTAACPDDGQTYATSLILRETARPTAAAGPTTAPSRPVRTLSGQLGGKTVDQDHVQIVLDRIAHTRAFTDVKLGGAFVAGRGHEVSFSIAFTYTPPQSAR